MKKMLGQYIFGLYYNIQNVQYIKRFISRKTVFDYFSVLGDINGKIKCDLIEKG